MRSFARFAFGVLILGATAARADACADLLARSNLTREQITAIRTARAASRELAWRAFTKVVRGQRKTVVLLGERARALSDDVAAARPVLDLFERIGTPSGSTNHEVTTPYLTEIFAGLLMIPSFALRAAFGRGRVAPPSSCAKDAARCKFVRNLERDHRPRWTEEVNLVGLSLIDFASVALAGPAIFAGVNIARGFEVAANTPLLAWSAGAALALRAVLVISNRLTARWPIVKNRDATVAKHLDDDAESTARGAYLGIVGRAHLPNLAHALVTEYGFEEIDLAAAAE